MDKRSFLKFLGIGAASAAIPIPEAKATPFTDYFSDATIAELFVQDTQIVTPLLEGEITVYGWDWWFLKEAFLSESVLQVKMNGKTYRCKVMELSTTVDCINDYASTTFKLREIKEFEDADMGQRELVVSSEEGLRAVQDCVQVSGEHRLLGAESCFGRDGSGDSGQRLLRKVRNITNS